MTTPGTTSLWRNHILPFTLLVTLLGVATVIGDYLLHRLDLVWVGRYLGIPGTLLIIGSLIYSLRKRKFICQFRISTPIDYRIHFAILCRIGGHHGKNRNGSGWNKNRRHSPGQ